MVVITLLHLDLGVGGAERLMVDAAVALKNYNHDVRIVTTHHDKEHCFEETKNGMIPVTVVGDWLPRSILGKCGALCSYIRMIYAALYVVFWSGINCEVAICDQVSACVPVLKLRFRKVIFYCHFPDLLLSKPGGFLKSLYRAPLNFIEEKSTGSADMVLVNSKFTRLTFSRTFTSLRIEPEVLYPSINEQFLNDVYARCDDAFRSKDFDPDQYDYFLSVNRYERKKQISLAIRAFARLLEKVDDTRKSYLRLVIAGGYDNDNQENITYYNDLVGLAALENIADQVVFLRTPCVEEKIKLMKSCKAVVYTPSNEHFGIVPLEAMFCWRPVIAVKSGGPMETVRHEQTGFLCPAESEAFADAMLTILNDKSYWENMGQAARQRFVESFSFEAFAEKLDKYVSQVLGK